MFLFIVLSWCPACLSQTCRRKASRMDAGTKPAVEKSPASGWIRFLPLIRGSHRFLRVFCRSKCPRTGVCGFLTVRNAQ